MWKSTVPRNTSYSGVLALAPASCGILSKLMISSWLYFIICEMGIEIIPVSSNVWRIVWVNTRRSPWTIESDILEVLITISCYSYRQSRWEMEDVDKSWIRHTEKFTKTNKEWSDAQHQGFWVMCLSPDGCHNSVRLVLVIWLILESCGSSRVKPEPADGCGC